MWVVHPITPLFRVRESGECPRRRVSECPPARMSEGIEINNLDVELLRINKTRADL